MRLPLYDIMRVCAKRSGTTLEGEVGTDPAATLGFSWGDYVKKVILPQCSKQAGRPVSAAELAEVSSLTTLSKTLSADRRFFVFHTRNDFLLKDGDCAWFRELMGERAIIMEQGSHCGNLHIPEVQQALLKVAGL